MTCRTTTIVARTCQEYIRMKAVLFYLEIWNHEYWIEAYTSCGELHSSSLSSGSSNQFYYTNPSVLIEFIVIWILYQNKSLCFLLLFLRFRSGLTERLFLMNYNVEPTQWSETPKRKEHGAFEVVSFWLFFFLLSFCALKNSKPFENSDECYLHTKQKKKNVAAVWTSNILNGSCPFW